MALAAVIGLEAPSAELLVATVVVGALLGAMSVGGSTRMFGKTPVLSFLSCVGVIGARLDVEISIRGARAGRPGSCAK